MAGVDHAYQYSVEVKSRFSLFLDDTLNSEDPDILLSKLQSKRSEKTKKDKPHVQQQHVAPAKVDTTTKSEVKVETAAPKVGSRVSKTTNVTEPPPVPPEDVQIASAKGTDESISAFVRGRGSGRGTPRGMRVGRGQGPRMAPTETPQDSVNDLNTTRGPSFEPRGRGRGRGRAMFGRGRGMPFNSNRDFDNQDGPDRQGPRQYGRRDGNWNAQDDDGQTMPESGDSEQVVRCSDGRNEVEDQSEHATAENEEGVVVNTETPVEEEPKSYTLEEYKAMRQSSKPAVLLNNKGLRKANDGKDVFANMVAHRKIQEVHEDTYEVEEKENEPEEHQSIDIDFSFADDFGSRRRGGRGFEGRGFDRGRGVTRGAGPRSERGGRGRGQIRSDGRGRGFGRVLPINDHIPPPAIYNDQEFPSLK
ncbi:unnamed protein product [Schistosoma margrebowiei]|uniref:Hyaluronan/mRNA-binding protein domain-containing protein n=1 Tax=Schistosoma margrebowiei TaxID=48269 RepID=A0AA85ALY2_9TREM|nr:unnamed protein product [Schistosoma margrebowiei]CAH8616174.1 unnamed protein product [Schistosoma margrebowiei]